MSDEKQPSSSPVGLGERLLYMLLFIICYKIAEIVVVAVIVFQVLHQLFLKERNQNLLNFGSKLSRYIYLILQYLNFNSDDRPFPIANWPKE